VTVGAVHRVALSVQQLNAAEAAVNRLTEKQLQLSRRLVELSTGRRIGTIQVGVCENSGG
jgi:hypothetical protein